MDPGYNHTFFRCFPHEILKLRGCFAHRSSTTGFPERRARGAPKIKGLWNELLKSEKHPKGGAPFVRNQSWSPRGKRCPARILHLLQHRQRLTKPQKSGQRLTHHKSGQPLTQPSLDSGCNLESMGPNPLTSRPAGVQLCRIRILAEAAAVPRLLPRTRAALLLIHLCIGWHLVWSKKLTGAVGRASTLVYSVVESNADGS